MRFFLILKENGEWLISPFAELDKPGETGEALQPALPLILLERLLLQAQGLRGTDAPSRVQAKNRMLKALSKERALSLWSGSWSEIGFVDEASTYSREFAQTVRGRQLTEGDLKWLAEEMHVSLDQIWRWADSLARRGEAEWLPPVHRVRGHWQCQRCGGEDVEEWPGIFGLAATCRECSGLGPATSIGVLFRSHGFVHDEYLNLSYHFQSRLPLTQAQEKAAGELREFVLAPEGREALIWAACGAGKTEVAFPAIDAVLRQGLPVLFAAPRQDVVLDVAPRLLRDFSGLDVPVLTGRTPGISRGSLGSGLVLATTHQVLRFSKAFSLIVLDEIDAFPYAGSRALAWGLERALRPGGKIICMTATPTERQIQSAAKTGGRLVRLPARHHGHPLPVPIWERLSFGDTGELVRARDEARFWAVLKRLRAQGPVLLFVPKIAWVRPWIERLRQAMPQAVVDGSFSTDPERTERVSELRRGNVDFFVSTSILERGVTIEGIQVVVLAADHPVFNERSLVQMAGRAGRSPARPDGEVHFWSGRKTVAIETSILWIGEQNALAQAQGLVQPAAKSGGTER